MYIPNVYKRRVALNSCQLHNVSVTSACHLLTSLPRCPAEIYLRGFLYYVYGVFMQIYVSL